MLSAKVAEKNEDAGNQSAKKHINLDAVKRSFLSSQTHSPAVPSVDKVTSDYGGDVETYRDESGRVRVSRVRGMGIRMTRDLQRNLDLMKEYEQDFNRGDVHTDLLPKCTREVSRAKGIPETSISHDASLSDEENSLSIGGETETSTGEGKHCFDNLSVHHNKPPLEISFLEDDAVMENTADDDLFLHLVSGTSTSALLPANFHLDRSKNEPEVEYVWEEGAVGEKDQPTDQNREGKSSLAEDRSGDEDEVEWEEGVCDVPQDTCCPSELDKADSRRLLEEEADIQEAIRKSLEDRSKNESKSEFDLDQGTAGGKDWQTDHNKESKSSLAEENSCEDNEVEWEEGNCDVPEVLSHCQSEEKTTVSHGLLEEEADIQEAIRRSLEDIRTQKASVKTLANSHLVASVQKQNSTSAHNKLLPASPCERCPVPFTKMDENAFSEYSCQKDVQQSAASRFDEKSAATRGTMEKLHVSSALDDSRVKRPHNNVDETAKHRVNHEEQFMNTDEQAAVASPSLRIYTENIASDSADNEFLTVDNLSDTLPANRTSGKDSVPANTCNDRRETLQSSYSAGRKSENAHSNQNPLVEERAESFVAMPHEILGNTSHSISTAEGLDSRGGITSRGELDKDKVASEASLVEEISHLRQERLLLRDEQRELARNAESVSSEMFAECQVNSKLSPELAIFLPFCCGLCLPNLSF